MPTDSIGINGCVSNRHTGPCFPVAVVMPSLAPILWESGIG